MSKRLLCASLLAAGLLAGSAADSALGCGPFYDGCWSQPVTAPQVSPVVLHTYPVADLVFPVNSAPGTACNTREETLIQLIQGTVRPETWCNQGGVGSIEYYPLSMSLVVNQTPEVQAEVNVTLQRLRALREFLASRPVWVCSEPESVSPCTPVSCGPVAQECESNEKTVCVMPVEKTKAKTKKGGSMCCPCMPTSGDWNVQTEINVVPTPECMECAVGVVSLASAFHGFVKYLSADVKVETETHTCTATKKVLHVKDSFHANRHAHRQPKSERFVEAYHKACAAGQKEEARKFAIQALLLDPTCFDKH